MATDRPDRKSATRIIHPDSQASRDFESLTVPTYRASTVVFQDMDAAEHPRPNQYRYGIYGTPTARELMLKLGAIEGVENVLLAPSGLAAISLTLLAFARQGGHLLLPASAYGPTRDIAEGLLSRLGVTTTIYDPMIGGGISALIRDETFLVWCESPGSVTMEVQDVPAIAAAARARGVPLAIDNTYGAGLLFDAFGAGCDISIQALSKYQSGHSDVLMGSVATRNPQHAAAIRTTHNELGMSVSPDDCSLVLRGLKTLDLRLRHVGESARKVAGWLAARDEVTAMLHPAFPDCPGHEYWKRDWTGSAGIFSVILGSWDRERVIRFVDSLTLFKIGYSWGGANSLAFAYKGLDRPTPETGPLLVRLNIGHEDPDDLIADIERALGT
ncbi:MAG: cystathionine beta-lyase [Sphingomicrobium sp.]